MFEEKQQFPLWLGGVLLAVVLIFIASRVNTPVNPVLQQKFAPQPIDPNAPTSAPFALPGVSVPTGLQEQFDQLRNRFNSGDEVPALTPIAEGGPVRMEIASLQRSGENVQVNGTIQNTGSVPLDVPLSAFSFQDSTGVAYAIEGSGQTTIQPGEQAPFNLEVPLPEGRGLTIILTLPSQLPLEQVLVPAAS